MFNHRPQVFNYPNKSLKPVYRVKQTSDNRYIPAEGKYKNAANAVETTYSLPQIAHHKIVVPKDPMEPVYNHLELPNPLRLGHPKIQKISADRNQEASENAVQYLDNQSRNHGLWNSLCF